MNEAAFSKKYHVLAPALYEFQHPDGRTDEQIAELQLRNEGQNPLEYRIADVEALIEQSRRLLADFDSDGAAFAEVTNRTALRSPDAAKAWLERMLSVWERVLIQLKQKPE